MKWNKLWDGESKKNKKDFREQRDGNRGIPYYLVAIYIGYMGYSILHNRLTGDETLSYPLAIFLTSIFVIGAAWIIWYAVKLRKNQATENEIKEKEEDRV